jgi:ubiquinone/menaquinone biosynthesis C-methylase UbiE
LVVVENRVFQEFERAGWEDVAGQYAEMTDGLTGGVAAVLCDAAGVSASSVVLDVASGPGWTAAVAAERAERVVGIDIAQAMVDLASARHGGVEFRQGTAEHLPFDDGSFDAVLSAFGMPHFADHGAFAAEAFRVLRPGGAVAFASWYPPDRNPFMAMALGSIARFGSLDVELPEGVDMFYWADQQKCQELLSGAGFGEASRVDVDLMFETDDGAAGIIRFLERGSVRSRALYLAQSDGAKAAIAEGLGEMMAPFETEGHWRLPLNAFVVSAVKPA